MPQGVQIWDAAGNLIFDTPDRVYKEFVISDVTVDGNVTVPSTSAPTAPAVVPMIKRDNPNVTVEYEPANNRVNWKFNGGSGIERVKVALL